MFIADFDMNLTSISDWIKIVLLVETNVQIPKYEERHFIFYTAICCDMIWMTINRLMKQSKREVIDPLTLSRQINQIYYDYIMS